MSRSYAFGVCAKTGSRGDTASTCDWADRCATLPMVGCLRKAHGLTQSMEDSGPC
jgi:hypothetical protein